MGKIMADCWICKQKAAWKLEKFNAAKATAKTQAHEQGKTMAIIKEGCEYKSYPIDSIPDGASAVEFVSFN